MRSVLNMKSIFQIVTLLSCLCLLALGKAGAQGRYGNTQSGGGFGQGGFSGGSGTGGGGNTLTLDTSDIYFFYADKPYQVYPFADSLLHELQQYDPIRRQAVDHASLGNLGSASRPLFFQPAWRRGLDLGLHQFDLYRMNTSDVRYYKITQAHTHASYSQGPTQSDAYFQVRFSRNFADGLNLSIEHRKINNTGAYDSQRAVNSDFAVGLWYHNPHGMYDGFFSYVTNSVEQQNNGGASEALDSKWIPAYQVDVFSSTSNTRYADRELAYTQYFYLNKLGERKAIRKKEKQERAIADSLANSQRDTLAVPPGKTTIPPGTAKPPIGPKGRPAPAVGQPPARPGVLPALPTGRSYTIYHQIAWKSGSYKFSDTDPDSVFYKDFLVDRRGLRHYLEARKLENTFKLQTFKIDAAPASTDSTGRALPRERGLVELGLVHAVHFIEQEPVDTQAIHNVFLMGSARFSPSERLRLQVYGHLGVGANAGDFRASGELYLNLKKIGYLRLEAVNQLYTPSFLPHRFYLTEREMWKNDFGKTLETSLSGTYGLPSFQFSVSGQYHLINNLVYFDTSGMPRQSGAFSVFQLMVRKDFRFGPLHFDNWAGLQQATSEVLALPNIYTRHSLYLEGKIFKKVMLSRIGLDARLATGYTPPGYQPATGQFYLQTGESLPFTPLVDAFFSFRVKTLRFFFKVENILPAFTTQYYYQTALYPLPFGFSSGGLRLGVNWRLVD